MQVEHITLPKGPIEYSLIGKGQAILILHGGHSNCQEDLSHKGLDIQEFQLITPSRPGYGRTPLHGNESPEQAAKLICELLDHLKIEKTSVLGISAGGPTAISFASKFPKRINKLVLASAVSKKWMTKEDPNYKKAKIIFRPGMEKVTWFFLRLFVHISPRFIAKNMFGELSTVKNHTILPKELKTLKSMLLKQGSGRGFINDLDQTVDEKDLEKISCPTLIVHSENDHAVNISHAHLSAEKISNSKLLTSKNKWGHLIWLGEEADEILAEINLFFLY